MGLLDLVIRHAPNIRNPSQWGVRGLRRGVMTTIIKRESEVFGRPSVSTAVEDLCDSRSDEVENDEGEGGGNCA